MRSFLLLAATCGLSAAAPQRLDHTYTPYTYTGPAGVVTGNSGPFSVGGYKAVSRQGSSGDVSLTTGTGAVLPTIAYGKREAEADPALVYAAYHPYAAYHYGAYAPYAYWG